MPLFLGRGVAGSSIVSIMTRASREGSVEGRMPGKLANLV